VKAVIEFEVEDEEEFLKKWEYQALPDEEWFLLDGASKKVPARKIHEDSTEKGGKE